MANSYRPEPPQLLPTTVADGGAPGVYYRIDGELVPVLHIWLDGSVPVFFEHHVILWKDPGLDIGLRGKGALKRMIAGMPLLMTEARGPGQVAFSRDGTGHVFPLHLRPGSAIEVREHQYLAATGNLEYGFTRQRGVGNMLFGSTGLFVDRFAATHTEGVVWLHGYGNVFEKNLAPGEQIDVEPGGWIYRDKTVRMDPQIFGLRTGIMGGAGNLVFNRFTGPGRVGIQSMYYGYDASGTTASAPQRQTRAGARLFKFIGTLVTLGLVAAGLLFFYLFHTGRMGQTDVPHGGSLDVGGNHQTKTIACNDGNLTLEGSYNTFTVTGHCASLH